MSNVAGEIYFIAEEPSLATPTVRVKIGLVRESDSRDSQDRLLDHQTGNPRSLVLIKAIKTARVSKVESRLHQHFAERRGNGEWFELTPEELNAAMFECEELAGQQAVHLPVIQRAESFKIADRGERIIHPDEESREWHRRLALATAAVSIFAKLQDRYRTILRTAYDAGVDISRYAKVTIPRRSFGNWLSEHHSAEYSSCKQTSRNSLFDIEDLEVDVVLEPGDSELVDAFKAALAEWSVGQDFEALHQLHLRARRPHSMWNEDRELAKTYLLALCGLNLGIEGICRWKVRSSNSFSQKIAEERFPELFSKYLVQSTLGKPSIRLRAGGDADS